MQMKTRSGHLFVRGKKMNKKQLIIMWAAIVLCIIMFFVPPEEYVGGRRHHVTNWNQLIAQWFLVGLVASGTIYTFRDKQKNDEKEKEVTEE